MWSPDRVTLTFDDGPGPSTPALLDVLAARGVHAVFFLLGASIERRRDAALRVAHAGHVLGNHTYSHARPGALTAAELTAEIARTDALLATLRPPAAPRPHSPPPLRLPYGAVERDPRLATLVALGRPHVAWTAEFADWSASDPIELARRMVAAAHPGAVLDLHDGSRRDEPRDVTVAAVARLIDQLGPAAFS